MNIAPDHCREHEFAQTDRIPKTRSKILSLLELGLSFILLTGCGNVIKNREIEKPQPTIPNNEKIPSVKPEEPKLPLESIPDYEAEHERAYYMQFAEEGNDKNMKYLIKAYAESKPIPERMEKVSVTGDVKVGTIVHIMQEHGESTEPTLPMTTAYQELMLEELNKAKPKHVFCEGIPDNIQGLKAFQEWQGINTSSQKGEEMNAIAVLFFNSEISEEMGLRPDIQNKRTTLLSSWGAGPAYALGNQAEIHGVESETIFEYAKLMSAQFELFDLAEIPELLGGKTLARYEKELDKLDAQMREVEDKREKEVISVVQKFLEKNPGETVYLIFGAGHDFSNEVMALKNIPTLKTIFYPKQAANATIEGIDDFENLEEEELEEMEENNDD